MSLSIKEPAVQGMVHLMERGWIPDTMIRAGIRHLCRQRDRSLPKVENEQQRYEVTRQFLQQQESQPVAVATDKANEQHYELPAEFFDLFLGPRRKYSSCFWPETTMNLAQAECASLAQVCERAELKDGMEVLELGCGWGAVSLWILEYYPNCRVTAVSNSASQRRKIESLALEAGWQDRLTVITADMNSFQAEAGRYDRVISLEMFEHMRNHHALLERVQSWLKDDGKFLLHVFCHRDAPYLFQEAGASSWMAKYFFTGGMMPSKCYWECFPELFDVEQQWDVNGQHYQKTLEAWLQNFDRNRTAIDKILAETYGQDQVVIWRNRWRLFLLACSELFGMDAGQRWLVGHYLLAPVNSRRTIAG